MNIYTHSVYWIHLSNHTDINTEGYIGVSNNPKRRFLEHLNDSKVRNDKNPFFGRVLKNHKSEVTQTIIFQGTEESCYSLEESLRPNRNIGWNANKGGSKPPSKLGWTPSKSTLEKRSKSLTGIPRTDTWRKKLSDAKIGGKNGMFGKKDPCSIERKISIIKSKNQDRLPNLVRVFELLRSGETIRSISMITGYGSSAICAIKKNPELHFEAFPILKQFKTS